MGTRRGRIVSVPSLAARRYLPPRAGGELRFFCLASLSSHLAWPLFTASVRACQSRLTPAEAAKAHKALLLSMRLAVLCGSPRGARTYRADAVP